MLNQFIVLKASKLSLIDRGRVQLRFPDYNHVTLEFDSSKTLQEILMTDGARSREDWLVRIAQCGVSPEDATDVLDGLIAVGAIHAERMAVSDAFDALLAHEDCRSRQIKKGLIDDFVINRVGVYGAGELARITQGAVSVVPGMQISQTVPDIVFVCCDIDDMPTLRETWKNAPEARLKIAFWFDGGALRLGPIYVAGETACISCFATRTDAASQFIDEATAYQIASPLAVCVLPLGPTITNLATYIVMRTLHLAKSGQFNVLEPGTLETWSILTGMSSKKFVLRNPFCPDCSDIDRPKRAIRDMT
ncbi:TOMM precursor leader peptide-binding protein [Vibrio mimicus]|uniref:TOMM precursor leader peptide-binding protein n=1 Tax=Vibrio mimicus TaxID=674 RepID=UPI002F93017D